jgi:hypothetical protein
MEDLDLVLGDKELLQFNSTFLASPFSFTLKRLNEIKSAPYYQVPPKLQISVEEFREALKPHYDATGLHRLTWFEFVSKPGSLFALLRDASIRVLERIGGMSVEEALKRSKNDWMGANFGKKSYNEIEIGLRELGLKLGVPVEQQLGSNMTEPLSPFTEKEVSLAALGHRPEKPLSTTEIRMSFRDCEGWLETNPD